MEYDIFKEIKARLDMPDLVKGYGIEIDRKGFCNCPFHAEKTPSMHIMEKGYYCFGCGEGGDHIKFVQKLFNLENPLDATKKINEDFKASEKRYCFLRQSLSKSYNLYCE